MQSEQTWRLRQARSTIERLTSDERYVDFGVRIYTVRQDPHGTEVYSGRPKVSYTAQRDFGGMLDCRTCSFVAPSENPVIWFAGEAQIPLLLRADDKPTRTLCYGAEGAGKTRVLGMWLVMRALEFTGQPVEVGATAPTGKRLQVLQKVLREIMPTDWYTWRAHEGVFLLKNGVTVRLAATKKYSEDVGSPVQGWDWAASASDELQDSLGANDDIEARGRRAPHGVYRRLCTATAKDSTYWRNWRDKAIASGHWGVERLIGPSNPFVFASYWRTIKGVLSARAYARRVLAQDVASELQIYHTFDRAKHIRPIPQIGAKDVTREALARWQPRGGMIPEMLIGHDPGVRQDVSVMLKAYQVGNDGYCWWVVDELTTDQTTAEQHATKLKEKLQREYQLQYDGPHMPKAVVICDPANEHESKDQPHLSTYRVFRRIGFDIKSAAPTKPFCVPQRAGVEMVLTLLENAEGKSRLFIVPGKAPRLIQALEESEMQLDGSLDPKRKGRNDLTHWPAALRYALWRIERELLKRAA